MFRGPTGLNGENSRPHWGVRPLCQGDCENSCMAGGALERWVDFMAERFVEQSFDRHDAAPQFFAKF